MKVFFLMAAYAAIFLCASTAAFAADVTSIVHIPWGEIVAAILPAVQTLIMGGVLYLAATYYPPVYAFLRTRQAEQLMARGMDFATNAVVGAVKGQTVSVNVGNEVLAEFVAYGLTHGGEWFTQFAGTPAEIAEKGFARISWPVGADKPDFNAIAANAIDKVASA